MKRCHRKWRIGSVGMSLLLASTAGLMFAQESSQSPTAPAPAAATDAVLSNTAGNSDLMEPAENSVTVIQNGEIQNLEVIREVAAPEEKASESRPNEIPRVGQSVTFGARVSYGAGIPQEQLDKLITILRVLNIPKAAFHQNQDETDSTVVIQCPADATWRRVRIITQALEKLDGFKVDVRVAADGGLVTSTQVGADAEYTAMPAEGSKVAASGLTLQSGVESKSKITLPESSLMGGMVLAEDELSVRTFSSSDSAPMGAFSLPMGLPSEAIPGKKWVTSDSVIIAIADDGSRIFCYCEKHPHWVEQRLEPLADAEIVPVVDGHSAAVMYGNYCFAYSTSQGAWDTLELPTNEVAVPNVSDDSVVVHSAAKGDFVFKNSWGRWFSGEEIMNGKVVDYIATRPAVTSQATSIVEINTNDLSASSGPAESGLTKFTDNLQSRRAIDSSATSVDESQLFSVHFVFSRDEEDVDQLRQTYARLNATARDIASSLHEPQTKPNLARKLNAQLRDAVQQAFETRQKLQRVELAEFARRLKGLQASIELRDEISQQIVERRVAELLDPNLKWEETATVDKDTSARELSGNAESQSSMQLEGESAVAERAETEEVSVEAATLTPAPAAGGLEQELDIRGDFVRPQSRLRLVLGKLPEELHDLLAQQAERVQQLRAHVRRYEARIAQKVDLEESRRSLSAVQDQLEEQTRRQKLAWHGFMEQIELLSIALERDHVRLENAAEELNETKQLYDEGVRGRDELRAAEIALLDARVAMQESEAWLGLYHHAGQGLDPAEAEADTETATETGAELETEAEVDVVSAADLQAEEED
ncbi:coiled-coil domain-containing protein [Aureliella helgolandensis]|uniref:Secreted protein n=1 Tax=Aureliella helgolandensis TaxID=2527968 RepID=A0A518GAT7_9BACT|nr:hypothetical protein [Aureliella helgolandensis]QDV25722.1 hypothetical protein Q31a_40490 [Aureliella helgolandensis]